MGITNALDRKAGWRLGQLRIRNPELITFERYTAGVAYQHTWRDWRKAQQGLPRPYPSADARPAQEPFPNPRDEAIALHGLKWADDVLNTCFGKLLVKEVMRYVCIDDDSMHEWRTIPEPGLRALVRGLDALAVHYRRMEDDRFVDRLLMIKKSEKKVLTASSL